MPHPSLTERLIYIYIYIYIYINFYELIYFIISPSLIPMKYTVSYRIVKRLRDSKSSQISRTLLSILAAFSNVVVLMASICPLIVKVPSPRTGLFVTVPSVSITFGITITFLIHIFFQFYCKVKVLMSLFVFWVFFFFSVLPRDHLGRQNPKISKISFFV